MSQQPPYTTAKDTTAEDAATAAVLAHHAQLGTGLRQRVEALVELVDTDHLLKAQAARQDLADYLRREIVPHAAAEEQALYPPAAALPEGRLLIEGMVAEHEALTALVTEVADAASLVRAAAAPRALAALFAVHLRKENDLVLPLLMNAPGLSLAGVLHGMHELLGGHAHGTTTGAAGGCGCGGCGCGGDRAADTSAAAAPVLTVDRRLDVRDVPHEQRHATVLSTVAALSPGEAVVLVASHAPRPVLAEIHARFGCQVQAQWLQSGPQTWQVRLERTAQPVDGPPRRRDQVPVQPAPGREL